MGKRIQSLQSLRGIAFLIIFCSHCSFVTMFSTSWGPIGVSIFVVLSGFVVTLGRNVNDYAKSLRPIPYARRRVSKIMPLHVITLLWRVAYELLRGASVPLALFLLNLTMTKSFVPDRSVYYSLGGPSWYLTLVWVFALLTPLLLKLLGSIEKGGGCWMPVFAGILAFRAVWILAWHDSEIFQWLVYINPLFRTTDYFLGMMLGTKADYIVRIAQDKPRPFAGFALFVGCWLLALCAIMSCGWTPWYRYYLFTPLSICLIVLCLCADRFSARVNSLIFENAVLVYIGNISFELFLIHTHAQIVVAFFFARLNIDSGIVRCVGGLALSVLIAISYRGLARRVSALWAKRRQSS